MYRLGGLILSNLLRQGRVLSTVNFLRRPKQLITGGCVVLQAMRHRLNTINEQLLTLTPEIQMKKPGVFENILEGFKTALRMLQLFIIFSPAILLSPLYLFEVTEDIWFWVLVKTIEKAGVVWIKSFQYLSHRHDIIGEKMAMKFMHLREHAPAHPFAATQDCFRREFGKGIDQIFDKFFDPPIASGSISQVYLAQYKGEKVAVKVRHPDVSKNIARDVNILFGVSGFLSKISSIFEFPITKSTLVQMLTDQLDFRIEQRNLNTFNELFHWHHNVHFPKVKEEVTVEEVLVESFVEGKPITYFEKHPHQLNPVIARIGALTFFEMLFKYNFIHADCHGGNIFVRLLPRSFSFKDWWLDWAYWFFRKVENVAVRLSGENQIAKSLYLESKREDDEARNIQRKLGITVDVTLIDAGMVLQLQESDRKNFVNFIRCIVEKEPEACASMVYSLSLLQNRPIVQNEGIRYERYYNELHEYFKKLTLINIKDLQGIELLKGMLYIVRDHGMKLNGQLGSLITNLLILEQIVRDLDPGMNILTCAVPYFYAPQP